MEERKYHLTSAREGALLLLLAIEKRNAARGQRGSKPMTRAQLTVPMLKRLLNRPRLEADFVKEVAEWLRVAGWVLFDTGQFFAMVRVSAAENWPRLSEKHISGDLLATKKGEFDFASLERLLWVGEEADSEGEDDQDSEDDLGE